MLSIGDKFPEIEVVTTHGVLKLPYHFRGKWFVLFSHPADFTPVCTSEFVAFAMKYEDFKKLNTELIGLSLDHIYSHMKWIEWIKEKLNIEISFPIIADPRGEVAQKLGLIHTQSRMNTVRGVYIVDDYGIVRAVLLYPMELGRNVDEILRMIIGLQVASKYGVAIPANWPRNELIESNVIIPPPKTIKEAHERSRMYKCFDWWFCYIEAPEDVEIVRKYK